MKKSNVILFIGLIILSNLASINFFFNKNENNGHAKDKDINPILSNGGINIITPENKSYIDPMSGYYPATFGFDNTLMPLGLQISQQESGTNYDLVDNYSGHNGVLKITTLGDGNYIELEHNFTEGSSGIHYIELWFYCVESDRFRVTLSEDTEPAFALLWRENGDIGGSLGTWAEDEWNHVRIIFDADNKNYWLYHNNVEMIFNEDFINTGLNINRISIRWGWNTGSPTEFYIDALGLSWYENYNKGDNKVEGLLLNFTSITDLEWSGYSLDGQSNITIPGNLTIPLPDLGSHTLRVYANDSMGTKYSSEVRYFHINYLSKPFKTNSHVYDWNITWGGSFHDYGYGAAIDSSDNLYIGGRTKSFGAGDFDLAVVKYDSSGSQQWNNTWGESVVAEWGGGVAVDSSENVYIVGYDIQSYPDPDTILVKYDNSGVQQWNRTWGGEEEDLAFGVAVDSLDNVYVCGETRSFGSGYYDIFLLKYHSSGVLLWNVTWGGSDGDMGYAIAIDSTDNVYVAGETIKIGSLYQMALVKYDNTGVLQWSRTWGNPGLYSDKAYDLTVDSLDNIYLIGVTVNSDTGGTDMALVKYDSTGVLQWSRTGDAYIGLAIAIDSSNNVYASGYIIEKLGRDMILVKYDSSGAQQWNCTWGGVYNEIGRDLIIDSLDNVYIAGQSASFGAGNNDMIIVKFSKVPEITINNPNSNEFFGSVAPNFNISIVESNLDTTWYSLYGTTEIIFSGLTGIIDQTSWDTIPDGPVTIIFYANNTLGNIGYASISVNKDSLQPQIDINYPIPLIYVENTAPAFDISITEVFLDTMWYTIDDGITNITFSEFTGTIDQTEWDKKEEGVITIQFYANDTLGKEGHAEVVVFKDIYDPQIILHNPSIDEIFGNIAPNYNISIVESNLELMWYTIDDGLTNVTFSEFTGTIDQTEWDKKGEGMVTVQFFANDTLGKEGYAEVAIFKDVNDPQIIIQSPSIDAIFGDSAPYYSISIIESNLESFWYTIDGGITNYTITQFSGTINQVAWDNAPYGNITIEFYAKDLIGNIGHNEVTGEKLEIIRPPSEIPFELIILSSVIGAGAVIGVVSVLLIRRKRKSN